MSRSSALVLVLFNCNILKEQAFKTFLSYSYKIRTILSYCIRPFSFIDIRTIKTFLHSAISMTNSCTISFSRVLELDFTSYSMSQIRVQCHHIGSLKKAMVGVFAPWRQTNITNYGFFLFFFFFSEESIDKHFLA